MCNFPSTLVSAWLAVCYSSPSVGQAVSVIRLLSRRIVFFSHTYTQSIPLPVRNEPKKKKKRNTTTRPDYPDCSESISPYPSQVHPRAPDPGVPFTGMRSGSRSLRVRTHHDLAPYVIAPSIHPPSIRPPRHLCICANDTQVTINSRHLTSPTSSSSSSIMVPQPEPTPAPADIRTRTHKGTHTQFIPNPDYHSHFTRLVGWLVG